MKSVKIRDTIIGNGAKIAIQSMLMCRQRTPARQSIAFYGLPMRDATLFGLPFPMLPPQEQ